MKQKPRSFRLNETDQENLLTVGNGNRTRGIRLLIKPWVALGSPHLDKDTNLAQVFQHYQETR